MDNISTVKFDKNWHKIKGVIKILQCHGMNLTHTEKERIEHDLSMEFKEIDKALNENGRLK